MNLHSSFNALASKGVLGDSAVAGDASGVADPSCSGSIIGVAQEQFDGYNLIHMIKISIKAVEIKKTTRYIVLSCMFVISC